MDGKGKKIVAAGVVVALVLTAGHAALGYMNYPSSQHVEIESQYVEALAEDDGERVTRLERTSELKHVQEFAAWSMAGVIPLYLLVTYGLYAYIRKHRLSARKQVGLTAVIVTLGSLLAGLLGAWIHYAAIGADAPDVSLPLVLLGAPVTLLLTFVIAAIVEYIYKSRNSFEA